MSAPSSLGALVRLFLRLGFAGFGGPLVHIAIMETEVVERRRWLSKQEFLDGLALCQMLPGPASTQLDVLICHARGGLRGALIGGAAFILPGFCVMLAAGGATARVWALAAMVTAAPEVYARLAWLWIKMGALVYGGGYVIIPVVRGEAVRRFAWMSDRVFLDGLALGQMTPGPSSTSRYSSATRREACSAPSWRRSASLRRLSPWSWSPGRS